MSELIGEIIGKREFSGKLPKYQLSTLRITRFYGGDIRGNCLQLSTPVDNIQLEIEQIKKLNIILTEFINEIS